MTPRISPLRAIAYSLLGYTFWVIADTCTRLAGKAKLPASQIIVCSSLFCIATILAIMAARGQMRLLKPKQWKGETFRALLYVVQSFINVTAFTWFPLAQVYVVLFLCPILTAMGASFFLREKISWGHGVAILAGFIGVVLALNPMGMNLPDASAAGYVALVLFPITGATNVLLIRYLSKGEHSESMTFFPQIVRVVVIVPLFFWQFVPMTLADALSTAGLGLFGAIGGLLVIAALKHAPVATVQPIAYTQLILGAIFGYMIWQDVPTVNLMIGAIIIIASNLYIARHAHKTRKTELLPETTA